MSDDQQKEARQQENRKKISEADEFCHNRNQAVQAQKQMASQETAGVFDEN